MEVNSLVCSKDVDPQEWDALATHLGGGYFHCYAHNKHSAARSHAETLFVKGLNKQDECIGVGACQITSSRFWPLSRYSRRAFLQTLPAANHNSEIERDIMAAMERHLRQIGVYQIDIASYDSPHSREILTQLDYELEERYEYKCDLTRDLDELWSDLKSQRRNQIRRSERLGVETREETTLETMELVQTFHALSMQRRDISVASWNDRDRELGTQLLNGGRIRILVNYHEGKPVNGYMCGVFNRKVYGLISGSSDAGNKVFGPIHIRWTAIKMFKEEGAVLLSLGGAKAEETGLANFKSQFGAAVVDMPYGRKIISQFGAKLDRLRRSISR